MQNIGYLPLIRDVFATYGLINTLIEQLSFGSYVKLNSQLVY